MKIYKTRPVFEPVIIKLETQQELSDFLKIISRDESPMGKGLYYNLTSGLEFKSEK